MDNRVCKIKKIASVLKTLVEAKRTEKSLDCNGTTFLLLVDILSELQLGAIHQDIPNVTFESKVTNSILDGRAEGVSVDFFLKSDGKRSLLPEFTMLLPSCKRRVGVFFIRQPYGETGPETQETLFMIPSHKSSCEPDFNDWSLNAARVIMNRLEAFHQARFSCRRTGLLCPSV